MCSVLGVVLPCSEQPERPVGPNKWEVHHLGTPFEKSGSLGPLGSPRAK
jgi:hypothetical protein